MNIAPTRIQEQISHVDRTRSLVIGILGAVTALWSIYRLFWLFYTAMTLSSVGFSAGSLVFPVVYWGALAVLGGFVAVAFLLRYSKQP